MPVALFAGLHVRDHDSAVDWYERLLGAAPSFRATDTESVWELAEHRWLYVQQNAEHAGHGVVTIFPEDLDAALAAAARRGVDPTRHDAYPGGARKAVFHDPDGNEIGLGAVPAAVAP